MYKTLYQKYRLLILILITFFIICVTFSLFKPKGILYDPITTPMKNNYTMKINKTEKLDNTNISLNEVLLDINEVYIKSHIWGKDKLVAIEAKKNPKDTSPLFAFTDLWIGGKLKFLPSSKGYFKLPLKDIKIASSNEPNTEDAIISPLYLSFYFSNGKSTTFKIEDNTNVKKSTKILNINKTIKLNINKKKPLYLKFGQLIKGITYTALSVTTTYYPKDIEITLLVNKNEFKATSGGYGGGIIGKIYFDPIEENNIKIKVKNTETNEKEIIPIKIN
ncbi:hypothetical protein G8S49_08550 [Clostridium botulinum C]|uniref:Uncharacterized protein n=4 Tax=Clostridiaceae TaxID=31979 RepID=A0A9Q4TIP9_CLOBO|nr:hypothetical protein CBCST_00685 [Clostridium botulinum C str. Stockholm]KEI07219.1 hypothetical protein Z957_08910 [Clostridium sp. K25]MCD3195106.1 hypothetical protein [Clostridium botulinum C]NFD87770.1 hypothetical protein [Clostridium botulinum]MCD3200446.1 hypothetical protein [Clostridium botulinum C]